MPQDLVVIGTGMAAIKTVEEILKHPTQSYQITMIGEELYAAYNRIMLSPVLAREKAFADIILHGQEWYEQHNICVKIGTRVEAIDTQQSLLTLDSGEQLGFDQLIIATGSRPFMIPLPGIELPSVMGFRTFKDVQNMQLAGKDKKRVAIIGGGLLGLEAANGLAKQGLDVHVIHNKDYILDRQLDRTAAKLLETALIKRGLRFITDVTSQRIIEGPDGDVAGLAFENRPDLACDMVIMAVGIRPNMSLAAAAGIECGRAIVVNDKLQTSVANIHALGECIEFEGQTFGLVAPLYEQAKVLAKHLTGETTCSYKIEPTATSLKVSGIQLFSAGEFQSQNKKANDKKNNVEHIIFQDKALGVYKKLCVKDNRLIGAVCYGDITDGQWYLELIQSQQDISELRDFMIFGQAFEDAA